MGLNTATVSLAVTPTIVSRLFGHYLDRKPLRQRPTAHLSYDEGLHLIRTFLAYASHHTVEEVQAFTAQWVPHPQWIKVEDVVVPDVQLTAAAGLIEEQLGPEGIVQVGGRKWWQWRKPQSPLHAEWVEMKADYNERKRLNAPPRRVMFYIHGGAYFFGSVDEHRYQMQRHARKLKARVFAPRYRLSPQFPFPCGLHDCLAAYLHLLSLQNHDPTTIVIAGDSAGGGMALALLVVLRDRGIPLPAGGILISPWVDLTHSFPSVSLDNPLDYIPSNGFHHRPSPSWPPPTEEALEEMDKLNAKAQAARNGGSASSTADGASEAKLASFKANRMTCIVDGQEVHICEQIQMYATNNLLTHPLVSPIMQPTLGGLPPLQITTGGGEILRDEQIYLAHKCANPAKYAPPDALLNDKTRAAVHQYKPTDVQLQVWEDLCHVPPTLSFTRPAKYMYRSIAQFGAWALARAQKTEIDILDDDQISVISSSSSGSNSGPAHGSESGSGGKVTVKRSGSQLQVGKAGDPLPPFKDHMIRQRVTRHGDIYTLSAATKLPGCCMAADSVGVVKKTPVTKWLHTRKEWDSRYGSQRTRVHKKRLKEAAVGFESFGPGEYPPPSALAGRRVIGADMGDGKKQSRKRSYALALWSLWGSKHDEMTMIRENKADQAEVAKVTPDQGGQEATTTERGLESEKTADANAKMSRSRSRRRVVRDEHQVEPTLPSGGNSPAVVVDENTPAADLVALGRAGHGGPDVDVATDSSNNKGVNKGGGLAVAGAGVAAAGLGAVLASGNSAGGDSGGGDSAMDLSRDKDVGRGSGVSGESCRENVSDAANREDDKRPDSAGLLTPDYAPDTGVTGKRAFLGGIAMPFSLKKEPDTASMLTLNSVTPSLPLSAAGRSMTGMSDGRSMTALSDGRPMTAVSDGRPVSALLSDDISSRAVSGQHYTSRALDDTGDDTILVPDGDTTIVDDDKTETGVSVGAVTALEGNDGTRSERLSFDSYVTASSEVQRLASNA